MDIVFNPLKEREGERLAKQTSYSLVHKKIYIQCLMHYFGCY
jgi:hypothetical protein